VTQDERDELCRIIAPIVDAEMTPLVARIADLERQIAERQWIYATVQSETMDACATHPPSPTAN
jgi:hypothetical protein